MTFLNRATRPLSMSSEAMICLANLRSHGLRVMTAALSLVVASMAQAQEVPAIPQVISPLYSEKDPNGVNTATGKRVMETPVVLSVPAAPRLKFDVVANAAPFIVGSIAAGDPDQFNSSSWTVHSGASKSDAFKCYYSTFCEPVTSGSTFRQVGRRYQEEGTGALYDFDLLSLDFDPTITANGFKNYYASKITYPDGEVITFTYDTAHAAGDYDRLYYRPTNISSNTGYHITIAYHYNGTDASNLGWEAPSEAAIYKSSDPATPLAKATYSLPNYPNPGQTTDLGSVATGGRVFLGGGGGSEVSEGSLQLPGEGSQALSATRASQTGGVLFNAIGSINRDGVTWTYTYANPRDHVYCAQPWPNEYKESRWDGVTVTGPNGYQMTYAMADWAGNCEDGFHNVVSSSTDALGRVTNYNFGLLDGRLYSVTYPEGNKVTTGYDGCGSIASKITAPKPGSGQPTLTETQTYPAAGPDEDRCPSVLNYRPTSYIDAVGRTTDYTYNSLGQMTQELAPADASGIRRQTNITYTVNAAGISLKSLVRVCGGTSCSGNAESRTEYTYFGNSSLPLTVKQVDEATGQSRTTTYAYDNAGQVLSVDGPLAGTNDAKYVRYDRYGRKEWEIGEAAPNGIRLAKKITYRDADDKATLVQSGTLSSPTDTTLTVEEQTASTYDSRRNPIREATSSGATTYRVTDRSFLDRGLADCSTVRMNLTALPAATATGACTAGTAGSHGSDRITKNLYDNGGQLTTVQKAFGTAIQQNYVAYTYTPNGKQLTVTDANLNKAQYSYDGYDRLIKWAFPDKVTTGLVSVSDYEQYGYDAAGNRTSLRKRDGSTLTYSYDGVNRMTLKVVPTRTGLTAAQTRDVYFGYDLLGRQLYARFDSGGGTQDGITNAYNGFGEMTSSTIRMGTFNEDLTYLYDVESRRTRLTHPDNQAFTYAYDALDRLTNVYEGAGTTTPLDGFAYNDDGTLASRTEGTTGFSSATYGWDAIGRLTSQSDVIAGTGANVSWGFTINPASQIASEARTETSNAYAFNGLVGVDRNYAVNGLNQYTAAGPATFTYDANGNLTADGTNTYTYDIENRLVKAVAGSVTTNLTYDPLGRLFQTDKGTTATTTKFHYDGDALVGEYDSSNNMTARYVHGSNAAADDPLVWYTGTGSSTKRWLHADHLGSVVGVTNNLGASYAKNAYDEYGIPGSANAGRFQYTGQAWIGELGMYYYKARIYSPTLGRFLQTDPIGYKDQYNLYAYVGNDPINATDPTGEYLETFADLAFIGMDVADIKENGLNWTNGIALGADVIGAALPGATGLGLGTRGVMEVGAKALHATQPRSALTMSRVEKMAKDMKVNGFDKSKPISVKQAPDGKRYIADGHHRVEAAKKAGLDKVPAKVEKVDQKAGERLREDNVNARCEDIARCKM